MNKKKYFKIFTATFGILLLSEIIYWISSYLFYYKFNPQDVLYWKILLLALFFAIIIYALLYAFLNKIYLFTTQYLIIYNSILGIILIIFTMLINKISIFTSAGGINDIYFFAFSHFLILSIILQLFVLIFSIILKKIYSFSVKYLTIYNGIIATLLITGLIFAKTRISINLLFVPFGWLLPPTNFLLLFLIFQLFISLVYKYKTPLAKLFR